MQFLWEAGKLRIQADEILGDLAAERGLIEAGDPIQAVVGRAIALTWTRDPFDRSIVGTALLHRAPLVTRDERIRDHYDLAIW
jgi:PIN domain nuclease of toxin-antitoxin system